MEKKTGGGRINSKEREESAGKRSMCQVAQKYKVGFFLVQLWAIVNRCFKVHACEGKVVRDALMLYKVRKKRDAGVYIYT